MNLFPRSGLLNHAVAPTWEFWPDTKAGVAVMSDEAPEAGIQVLAGAIGGDINHNVAMQCAIGALEEGIDYYISYIIRPGIANYAFIREGANSQGASHKTWFDLANRTFGSLSSTHRNPIMQYLEDGLLRIGLAYTPEDLDTAIQNTQILGFSQGNGQNTFVATEGEHLADFFHAQIEVGNHPSAPEVTWPGKGQN